MKYCQQCGKEADDNAIICKECGSAFFETAAIKQKQMKTNIELGKSTHAAKRYLSYLPNNKKFYEQSFDVDKGVYVFGIDTGELDTSISSFTITVKENPESLSRCVLEVTTHINEDEDETDPLVVKEHKWIHGIVEKEFMEIVNRESFTQPTTPARTSAYNSGFRDSGPSYSNNSYSSNTTHEDPGSYGAGFALGFLLAIIGLIVAIAIGKSETKRGAVHGFIFSLILYGAIFGFYMCSVASLMAGYY